MSCFALVLLLYLLFCTKANKGTFSKRVRRAVANKNQTKTMIRKQKLKCETSRSDIVENKQQQREVMDETVPVVSHQAASWSQPGELYCC